MGECVYLDSGMFCVTQCDAVNPDCPSGFICMLVAVQGEGKYAVQCIPETLDCSQYTCVNGKFVCQPNCVDKECGDDGCGGSCEECTQFLNSYCDKNTCKCSPDCLGKNCGDDGCGGNCGNCWCGSECQSGECVFTACINKECGNNGCGGSCGECTQFPNSYCDNGMCKCSPNCLNKECGDNGCDGGCGTCTNNTFCDSQKCVVSIDVDSKLPDTGQEECYDWSGKITCPDYSGSWNSYFGQDAQYSTNPMSFKDNGDGTITDNVTGLMWMKCSAGLEGVDCKTGSAVKMIWQPAIDYCDDLVFAGYDDWRLPDAWELQTVVNYGKKGPAIDGTYFPNSQGLYWSSSICASNLSCAWDVDFYFGEVGTAASDYVNNNLSVKCVRLSGPKINQYKDNGDGTVTDTGSLLMWQKLPSLDSFVPWDSLKHCEELTLAGFTDWRVPDIKELFSLIDKSKFKPAVNTDYFPNIKTDRVYRSSTSLTMTTGAEWWYVDFYLSGQVDFHVKGYTNFYVWCVRSLQ